MTLIWPKCLYHPCPVLYFLTHIISGCCRKKNYIFTLNISFRNDKVNSNNTCHDQWILKYKKGKDNVVYTRNSQQNYLDNGVFGRK